MLIVLALSNTKTRNQMSRNSKTQPSRKLVVAEHCLARTCKKPTIPRGT